MVAGRGGRLEPLNELAALGCVLEVVDGAACQASVRRRCELAGERTVLIDQVYVAG